MKKRIFSFVLVFAMVCAMSISAYAGSAFSSGLTLEGGDMGQLECKATLDVDSSRAYATTWNEARKPELCTTVATLYCLDSNGDEVPYTDQGGASVSVWGEPTKGVRGASFHGVYGGYDYSSWSCTLYADK